MQVISKENFSELEEHFISENLRMMILCCMKKSSEKTKTEGRKFLNDKVRQRKNLYIYPVEDNV